MLVLSVMLCAASWIALGTVRKMRRPLFLYALLAILLGGGLNILVVSQGFWPCHPVLYSPGGHDFFQCYECGQFSCRALTQ